MKTTLHTLALCAALLLTGLSQANAQGDDRAGTAAMEELLVPVTPRTVALGSTIAGGLTTMSGVEALLSNPAAVMVNGGTNAMFSRTEYMADADIGINFFGVAQRFGNNNVALTLTAWDYGDIPFTTEDNPEISGDTWQASTIVLGASFARQFTDRIAAGFTVKGLSREIDQVQSQGIAVDGGMTYVVGESGLRFGISLQNVGGQMSFSGTGLRDETTQPGPNGDVVVTTEIEDLESELPSFLNFGASYTREIASDVNATVVGSFQSNSYDQDQYTGGIELDYQSLFYVRGGLNLTGETDVQAFEVWNLGAGVNLDLAGTALMVDYAYRPSNVFGGTNIFSVGIGL